MTKQVLYLQFTCPIAEEIEKVNICMSTSGYLNANARNSIPSPVTKSAATEKIHRKYFPQLVTTLLKEMYDSSCLSDHLK